MADSKDLDPEIRSFALVGQFLHRWSAMESVMHDCIQTAFRLTPTMRGIICANVSFRDKLHILRTVVDVLNIDKQHNRTLRHVGSRYKSRNMIAHERFHPVSNGSGIRFEIVIAKGTFSEKSIKWSEKTFHEEFCLLDKLTVQLSSLNTELGRRPPVDNIGLPLMIWAASPNFDSHYAMPMRSNMSPGLADLLSRQIQAPPDSDPTSQEQTPQTPEKPEG